MTAQPLDGAPPAPVPVLRDLLVAACARAADATAVVHAGRRLTYREIDRAANTLAHALAEAGAGPGVPVAIMLPTCPEWVIADQAVLRCGATKVPVGDMLSKPECEFILRDCGAAIALTDESRAGLALAVGDRLDTVIVVGEPAAGAVAWDELLARPAPDGPPATPIAPSDPAMIAYTGGTTGRQKGVVHTQASLALNLLAHVIELELGDRECLLLSTPLPHSAGYLLQAGMLKGATHLLETKFDPDRVLDALAGDGVTLAFMVPTMIYRLLDRARDRFGAAGVSAPSLRTVLYGAAPIAVDRLAEGLRMLGPVFVQLYGQTEAPNFLTRLSRHDHDPSRPELLTSCGRPALMVEIEVRDASGRRVPDGEAGQVCARAPYLMSGYLGLPEVTAETLIDGWLHTGDIGYLRNGYLHLLDRAKDMLISGGMNVYTTEVENVLAGCPEVSRVAVVGVPHPDWGEAVVAFVVPAQAQAGDGADVDIDTAPLVRRCAAELATYKRPKAYRIVRDLPVTPFGKVDKKQLRAGWDGW